MSDAPTGISLIATGLVAEIVPPTPISKLLWRLSLWERRRFPEKGAWGATVARKARGGSHPTPFSKQQSFSPGKESLHHCVTIGVQHSEVVARPVL
jgi:hypothetical protein